MIKDVQHISDLIASLHGLTVQQRKVFFTDYLYSSKKELYEYEKGGKTMDDYVDYMKNQYDYAIKPLLLHEQIELVIEFYDSHNLGNDIEFLNFLDKHRFCKDDKINTTLDTFQDNSKKIIFIEWLILNEKLHFEGLMYYGDSEQRHEHNLTVMKLEANLEFYKQIPQPVAPKEPKPEPIGNKERITQIIDTLVANEYKSGKTFINIQLKKHFTDLLNKDLNSKPQQWNDTGWMLYVLIEKFIELELLPQINDIPEYILRHFMVNTGKKTIKDSYNRAKANRKFSDFTAKLNEATAKFQNLAAKESKT